MMYFFDDYVNGGGGEGSTTPAIYRLVWSELVVGGVNGSSRFSVCLLLTGMSLYLQTNASHITDAKVTFTRSNLPPHPRLEHLIQQTKNKSQKKKKRYR